MYENLAVIEEGNVKEVQINSNIKLLMQKVEDNVLSAIWVSDDLKKAKI